MNRFWDTSSKTTFTFSIIEQEGQNGGVRISVSGQERSDIMKRQISSSGAKPSTIAEEAVDQLQENEKLVAGKFCFVLGIRVYRMFLRYVYLKFLVFVYTSKLNF